MLPEEKKLLDRSVELSEDNNKMLHSMRRSMFWSRVIRIVYWVLIISSAVGAYYFIQPYVSQIISVYNTAQSNLQNVNNMISGFKK